MYVSAATAGGLLYSGPDLRKGDLLLRPGSKS